MEESYAQAYADLYHRHWWWRSREAILLDEIRRLDLSRPCRILDVGCGSGLFLPRLAEFGEVWGIETDTDLVRTDTPFREQIYTESVGALARREAGCFDLITALDVIEHIEDDEAAVRDMVRLLAAGGRLLITVPAFMALWDEHDDINLHYRRYTKATLRSLVAPHGRIEALRYFFHTIFLPKLAVTFVNRRRTKKIAQHRVPAVPINRGMQWLCRMEYRILRRQPVPFGTSVMAIFSN